MTGRIRLVLRLAGVSGQTIAAYEGPHRLVSVTGAVSEVTLMAVTVPVGA